ncbi:hypothetical protein BCR34DRAFT_611372 [Clohesyomyces aquaticus]|uniref:Uncharacterized protein n=1 Tax=Clohesyomyces aquaticus TaxID=1231657 RepID=A0A1Y2A3B9_9PLEO|nr:hypothetical protein BCR34DRAFT_611372 [Clohesyomyces aquaticus]
MSHQHWNPPFSELILNLKTHTSKYPDPDEALRTALPYPLLMYPNPGEVLNATPPYLRQPREYADRDTSTVHSNWADQAFSQDTQEIIYQLGYNEVGIPSPPPEWRQDIDPRNPNYQIHNSIVYERVQKVDWSPPDARKLHLEQKSEIAPSDPSLLMSGENRGYHYQSFPPTHPQEIGTASVPNWRDQLKAAAMINEPGNFANNEGEHRDDSHLNRRLRMQKFDETICLAPPPNVDIRLIPFEVTAQELVCMFTRHVAWPELLHRLMQNGWILKDVILAINLHRQCWPPGYQSTNWLRSFLKKSEEAISRTLGPAAIQPVNIFTVSQWSFPSQEMEGSSTPVDCRIVDLANGIKVWPSGTGAHILTQVIRSAVDHGRTDVGLSQLPQYLAMNSLGNGLAPLAGRVTHPDRAALVQLKVQIDNNKRIE